MKILSNLFILFFVYIPSLILFSCSQSDANSELTLTKDNVCKCNLSDLEMTKKFPITAKNDSIIICRKGIINGMDWTTFLSQNVLNDYFPIYNCQTDKGIRGKFSSISATYQDKSLIIFSHKDFIAYDVINEKWIEKLRLDVYKEKIFAHNSQIGKSEPVFVLTPPLLNKKAIDEIDKMYEDKVKNLNNRFSSWLLVEYLLIAALNGDEKSKLRLQNFQNSIPTRSGDGENNPPNLALALEILDDFEKYKLGNEIEYLDLEKRAKFQ